MSEVPLYRAHQMRQPQLTRSMDILIWDSKADIRLHGKRNSKLAWCKTGQPRHLVDVVDSDQ